MLPLSGSRIVSFRPRHPVAAYVGGRISLENVGDYLLVYTVSQPGTTHYGIQKVCNAAKLRALGYKTRYLVLHCFSNLQQRKRSYTDVQDVNLRKYLHY